MYLFVYLWAAHTIQNFWEYLPELNESYRDHPEQQNENSKRRVLFINILLWCMYVVVNFFISGNFYFPFSFNFISIHYQTPKQKKNKNYMTQKVNYNMYTTQSCRGFQSNLGFFFGFTINFLFDVASVSG